MSITPSQRKIIHVDMDAFYASVEIRERPELAGKPVIVGGHPERRGVVSAANYLARRYGVHSAMPMSQAMRLCPQAERLAPRLALYSEVSDAIHEIFARYTPEIEPLSLDEAFLDVTASESLFGSAEQIAREIKTAIRRELQLVASVGVAPSKFIAKIASDIDKPDGFVVVTEDEVTSFVQGLPVSRLWGVGKSTEAVLQRYGIKTVKQLQQYPLPWLEQQFGKAGQQMFYLARGEDHRPVISERKAKSISAENTFAQDSRDHGVLTACLMELVEQVAWRLRRKQLYAGSISLKVRFADFKTLSRVKSLEISTDKTEVIHQVSRQLLETLLRENSKPVRLIGTGVSGLTEQQAAQADLFTSSTESPLDRVADAINNRFGKGGIQRASVFRKH